MRYRRVARAAADAGRADVHEARADARFHDPRVRVGSKWNSYCEIAVIGDPARIRMPLGQLQYFCAELETFPLSGLRMGQSSEQVCIHWPCIRNDVHLESAAG